MMYICEFLYISAADLKPKRAVGIQKSWKELKQEMARTGPGYPGAIYFKTISSQGPQLFAVVNGDSIFYHDQGVWHQYKTACEIKVRQIEMNGSSSARAVFDDTINQLNEDESDWVLISQDECKP